MGVGCLPSGGDQAPPAEGSGPTAHPVGDEVTRLTSIGRQRSWAESRPNGSQSLLTSSPTRRRRKQAYFGSGGERGWTESRSHGVRVSPHPVGDEVTRLTSIGRQRSGAESRPNGSQSLLTSSPTRRRRKRASFGSGGDRGWTESRSHGVRVSPHPVGDEVTRLILVGRGHSRTRGARPKNRVS